MVDVCSRFHHQPKQTVITLSEPRLILKDKTNSITKTHVFVSSFLPNKSGSISMLKLQRFHTLIMLQLMFIYSMNCLRSNICINNKKHIYFVLLKSFLVRFDYVCLKQDATTNSHKVCILKFWEWDFIFSGKHNYNHVQILHEMMRNLDKIWRCEESEKTAFESCKNRILYLDAAHLALICRKCAQERNLGFP